MNKYFPILLILVFPIQSFSAPLTKEQRHFLDHAVIQMEQRVLTKMGQRLGFHFNEYLSTPQRLLNYSQINWKKFVAESILEEFQHSSVFLGDQEKKNLVKKLKQKQLNNELDAYLEAVSKEFFSKLRNGIYKDKEEAAHLLLSLGETSTRCPQEIAPQPVESGVYSNLVALSSISSPGVVSEGEISVQSAPSPIHVDHSASVLSDESAGLSSPSQLHIGDTPPQVTAAPVQPDPSAAVEKGFRSRFMMRLDRGIRLRAKQDTPPYTRPEIIRKAPERGDIAENTVAYVVRNVDSTTVQVSKVVHDRKSSSGFKNQSVANNGIRLKRDLIHTLGQTLKGSVNQYHFVDFDEEDLNKIIGKFMPLIQRKEDRLRSRENQSLWPQSD